MSTPKFRVDIIAAMRSITKLTLHIFNRAEKSDPIALTMGDCVELISWHMEGVGRDFLDVGVEYPDATKDFEMSQYICYECRKYNSVFFTVKTGISTNGFVKNFHLIQTVKNINPYNH